MGTLLANWKTTLTGVVTAVLTLASDSLCDALGIADQATRDQVRGGILAVGIALVGILSRDSNVTSEQSGAK